MKRTNAANAWLGIGALVEPDSILSSSFFLAEGSQPGLEGVDLLAVYLLPPKVCSPCINEVVEYTDLMQDLEKEGLRVEAVAFLPDEDLAWATHFVKTVNLPMPNQ